MHAIGVELSALDLAVGKDACAGAVCLAVLDLPVVDPGRVTVALARQHVASAHLAHARPDLLRQALRLRQAAELALVLAVIAAEHRGEHRIGRDLLAVEAEEVARAFADGRLQPLEVALGARAGLLRAQHETATDVGRAKIGLGDRGFVLELEAIRDLGIDLGPRCHRGGEHTGAEDECRQERVRKPDRLPGALVPSVHGIGNGRWFSCGGRHRHDVLLGLVIGRI
ncbi:hypothetical protein D3C85_994140 [compost metagenome]